MKASEIALPGGRIVTKRAGNPKPETATATFASPPPNVAMNCGDCMKRSKPGGARRSMISPKVTTVLDMNFRLYQCLGNLQQVSIVQLRRKLNPPVSRLISH